MAFELLKRKNRWFSWLLSAGMSLALLILLATLWAIFELPGVDSLSTKKIEVPMKIYSADHRLIAEYGDRDSTPIALQEVPPLLVKAVLATEDSRFYEHGGVDFIGLARATLNLVLTGRKSQGASTITMQVARNFYLSREKTYLRKFKEILLAIKIDNELSKDRILELYLDKIYFGHHAYGVYAASMNYYGVEPKDLTLPQIAMLAGLPQAPSRNNPLTRPHAAKARRNHVLRRMLEVHDIDQATYEEAVKAPLTAKLNRRQVEVRAPHVAEYVRQILVKHYGADSAYHDGFEVVTTIDSHAQSEANQAVENGLLAYDARHGYVGPVDHVDPYDALAWEHWQTAVVAHPAPGAVWKLAWIIGVEDKHLDVMVAGRPATIHLGVSQLKLAQRTGPKGAWRSLSDLGRIFKLGDVIWLRMDGEGNYRLSQLPAVQSALVAMDSGSGAIEAWVGGDPLLRNSFDHVTQAWRQPGSCIKPYLLSVAMQRGYKLTTLINDAPFVKRDYGENQWWRPNNDNYRFNGPTTLRYGLVHSRNLVFIRLLSRLGIDNVMPTLSDFGFDVERQPHSLSLALGAGTTTPLQLVSAYSTFLNQGMRQVPYLVHEVRDSQGVLFTSSPAQKQTDGEPEDVDDSREELSGGAWYDGLAPWLAQSPVRVLSPQDAFLVYDALRDVVRRGTGRGARSIGRKDLTGKTGTTNHRNDAWFTGSGDHLISVVWVGFDNNLPVNEYGSKAALPIWRDFMASALKGRSAFYPKPPEGLVKARIDPKTGELSSYDEKGEFEWFKVGQVPAQSKAENTGKVASDNKAPTVDVATIYD